MESVRSDSPTPLSLSLSSSRRVSVSILSGKKRKTSVDYYPRHIGSRAAAGETTWSVVTIDSIEIRDPVAGAASMEMFSLFFFSFPFFFFYLDDAAEIGIVTPT